MKLLLKFDSFYYTHLGFTIQQSSNLNQVRCTFNASTIEKSNKFQLAISEDDLHRKSHIGPDR